MTFKSMVKIPSEKNYNSQPEL